MRYNVVFARDVYSHFGGSPHCRCAQCNESRAVWREHFFPLELMSFVSGSSGVRLVVGGDPKTLLVVHPGELPPMSWPKPYTWDRGRIVHRQTLGFIGLLPIEGLS